MRLFGSIFASAISSGLYHGEDTFIVVLVPKVVVSQPVLSSMDISTLLYEFSNLMSFELPRRLPHHREINHRIELILRAIPPSRDLYRMPPLELDELMKQLDELLSAGFIRLSSSPYRAFVLF